VEVAVLTDEMAVVTGLVPTDLLVEAPLCIFSYRCRPSWVCEPKVNFTFGGTTIFWLIDACWGCRFHARIASGATPAGIRNPSSKGGLHICALSIEVFSCNMLHHYGSCSSVSTLVT
jgi:hypothetical protein